MAKKIAIYVRVSSKSQTHASQEPDLKRWAETQAPLPVQFYFDKKSGKTQEREGWQKLEKDLRAGKLAKVACWKIDRLGRTARELLMLFNELRERKVDLVCVAGGIMGLDTAEGRLMAGIVAQFAEYDNECRSERIVAGQSAARAKGKKWGGSKPGVRKVVTDTQLKVVRQLHAERTPIAHIAKAVSLSRQTIYTLLKS